MIDHKTIKWKNRIVSTKRLWDEDTGEETFVRQLIKDVPTDVNWQTVWLKNILFAYDIIGDKKVHVLSYLLGSMDSENKVICSISSIARHLEISRPTVQTTIDLLIENDIIKKLPEFGYFINPNIVFDKLKAQHNGVERLDILHTYMKKKIKPKENHLEI